MIAIKEMTTIYFVAKAGESRKKMMMMKVSNFTKHKAIVDRRTERLRTRSDRLRTGVID